MEEKTRKSFQTIPPNMRRGFRRLYIVVAAPWVAWFGFRLLTLLNTHYYWDRRDIYYAFWMLLLVPAGMPILYGLGAWVFSGFREAVPAPKEKSGSPADYKKLLTRAVSQLPVNDSESRKHLYERAEAALAAQIQNQPQNARIATEKKVFQKAVRSVEQEEQRIEQLQRKQKKGSTALLVVSMFAPGLWAMDFTSMSLYWVARSGDKANDTRIRK